MRYLGYICKFSRATSINQNCTSTPTPFGTAQYWPGSFIMRDFSKKSPLPGFILPPVSVFAIFKTPDLLVVIASQTGIWNSYPVLVYRLNNYSERIENMFWKQRNNCSRTLEISTIDDYAKDGGLGAVRTFYLARYETDISYLQKTFQGPFN